MAGTKQEGPAIRSDGGPSPRARLGFVILATDETSEADLFRMAPPGIGLHFSRIDPPERITARDLSGLMRDLGRAASLLLPGSGVDIVSLHCTSGSLILGEETVRKELARACPGAIPTTVVSALGHALESLEVKAFSLLTPYTDDINDAFVNHFTARGYRIPRIRGMQLGTDSEIARVCPETISAWAEEADHKDAETLIISCTGLRAAGLVGELEKRLGKPVITSNQAALWHMLRSLGLKDRIRKLGTLFSR
jgi:maleate isomerase